MVIFLNEKQAELGERISRLKISFIVLPNITTNEVTVLSD